MCILALHNIIDMKPIAHFTTSLTHHTLEASICCAQTNRPSLLILSTADICAIDATFILCFGDEGYEHGTVGWGFN